YSLASGRVCADHLLHCCPTSAADALPRWRPASTFFCDAATPEHYALSLHDALPIYKSSKSDSDSGAKSDSNRKNSSDSSNSDSRSEEHTSELQSCENLVCRLLLEKKNASISVRPISSVQH